jgi:hypoxanthine phosphoribosyltransferase
MSLDELRQYPEMGRDISEILISAGQIQNRIQEMGAQITQDYQDKDLMVIGVLKGVTFFIADLLRAIRIPLEVDFLAVASYSAEARNQGLVRLVKDLETPINGREVLFVEDMVDTGLTLNYLLRSLRMRQPASLQVCTLFNKPGRRLVDTPIKYTGFDLPDLFVVGYGLDFRERYRNLPFVGVLKPQVFQRPGKDS